MKIALCLLTRNELPCLKQLFQTIPKPGNDSGFDAIYAIDGNSTDGTQDFYKEHNIPIIEQKHRTGRGNAFHLAFEQIDTDAYIFFSPDGNESVADIKKFKTYFQSGSDLVIASRMMKDAVNEEDNKIFRWRKWANNAFNLLVNIFFKTKNQKFITDSINGFRGITRNAVNQLNLDATGYTIEFQITIRALKKALKISEFPTIEGQRLAGSTGAPSIPTGFRFLHCLYREVKLKFIK